MGKGITHFFAQFKISNCVPKVVCALQGKLCMCNSLLLLFLFYQRPGIIAALNNDVLHPNQSCRFFCQEVLFAFCPCFPVYFNLIDQL